MTERRHGRRHTPEVPEEVISPAAVLELVQGVLLLLDGVLSRLDQNDPAVSQMRQTLHAMQRLAGMP